MKFTQLSLCLLLLTSHVCFAENKLQTAVKETLETNAQAEQSQEHIDAYVDKTKDMLQQYRTILRKTESLKAYNEQLEKLTDNQLETVASLDVQINSIAETQQNIVPFLLRMVETLDEFIALDSPFLKEERTSRVALLKDMMDRPDVSLSDKYRRIMEAYQIEMEYGRTIDATTGTIQTNNSPSTVDLLRIGRLSIFYQTLDGKESGYWDKREKQWKPLSEDYNRSIAKGLQIAKKQAPPDLIKLPVVAPDNLK